MSDSVVRAITEDGSFRVIVALTTATVRGATRAQGAEGAVAQVLGELVTGAVLVREAMAPKLRVQVILRSAGGEGTLVADAHPDGTSRGLVSFGAGHTARELRPGKGALLQVMRTLPSGALHQGVVAVPGPRWGLAQRSAGLCPQTPEGGCVSGALMAYMQESEQVVSTIGVAAVLDGADVAVAGGYLVQLLPEVERGPLAVMTERLADFTRLDEVLSAPSVTPDALLAEILHGMPYARLEASPLDFGCNCSQVRVVSTLATLPRSDIEDMVKDGEVLEIHCDYCRKEYRIPPAQLTALLVPS